MAENDEAQQLVSKIMGDDGSSDDEAPSTVQTECLRHLCATDPTPLDEVALTEACKTDDGLERFLHRAATEATDALLEALWKLPTERTSQGPVATLPPQRGVVLPREKPVPVPKPPTRWEQFAAEKGIEKKKRERMVWDDVEQKWAPRYGYKRAYGDAELPIMEVGAHDDPNEDPWEKKRVEKKMRVAKNEGQRTKNEERQDRRLGGIKAGIPVDLPGSAGHLKHPLEAAGGGAAQPRHKGKDGVAQALTLAQHSTASMGAFDVRRQGEPGLKKQGHTRRAKAANDLTPAGLAGEKARNAKLLDRVLAAAERPTKPNYKGAKGEAIEARKRSREFHPLDDSPFENLGGGEAGEYKKKKGRAAGGKLTKITKKRAK